MKRLVLSSAMLFISGIIYSQEFAYSFRGNLTLEKQESIKKEILSLPRVNSCDLKLKPEKQVGEFFFYVEPLNTRTESPDEFSPVMIKTLFIENNLEPMDFRQIK